MNNLLRSTCAIVLVVPLYANSHSGEDAKQKLDSKHTWFREYQTEFDSSANPVVKRKLLQKQIRTLTSRVQILQREIRECEGKSCFDGSTIDFSFELKRTLKNIEKTLRQVDRKSVV